MTSTEEHGPFCAGCVILENIALKKRIEELEAQIAQS